MSQWLRLIVSHNESDITWWMFQILESPMLKKITAISNAGVYADYHWDQHVVLPSGQRDRFMEVNVIYGRNYSGKTTLSRLIRSMQTGALPENLPGMRYSVEFDGGEVVTNEAPAKHSQLIRVFNEDFVKENLSILFRDDGSVIPFAVLGKENTKIRSDVEALEAELGGDSGGLLHELTKLRDVQEEAVRAHATAQKSLHDKLDAKANKAPSGIKHNKLWGDPNYRVPRLEQDIARVLDSSYENVDDAVAASHVQTIKEEVRADIPALPSMRLRLAEFLAAANELLARPITVAQPIQELLNDAVLQNWVREGRKLHEGKRERCGFCGNAIPEDLWSRMHNHFNRQSEILESEITALCEAIVDERSGLLSFAENARSSFYSDYQERLGKIIDLEKEAILKYSEALGELEGDLQARKSDIFSARSNSRVTDCSFDVENARRAFELLRTEANDSSQSLGRRKAAAIEVLRLKEVRTFVNDVGYLAAMEQIEALDQAKIDSQDAVNALSDKVRNITGKIASLNASTQDESRGAARVNELLADFFGHRNLALRSLPTDQGYRFEIIRGDAAAMNLSQGECSLIAFCYFIATLDNADTSGREAIIWIDDPVSSLDANHVFFLFGLIRFEILRKARCSQLFVCTHHLDFLRFVIHVVPDGLNLQRRYFMIERSGDTAKLKLMPKYFKAQVSEFVYLFDYLYKCGNAATDAHDVEVIFAGYANNARKFLEIFLGYKYPGLISSGERIRRYFGESGVGAALIDQLHHEYSHADGSFERSLLPLDIAEMRQSAQFVLETMQRKDAEQYDALVAAIANI